MPEAFSKTLNHLLTFSKQDLDAVVKAERDRTRQGSGVGGGLYLTTSGHQQTVIDGHRTEPAQHGHRERHLNEDRAALPGADRPPMQLKGRHS